MHDKGIPTTMFTVKTEKTNRGHTAIDSFFYTMTGIEEANAVDELSSSAPVPGDRIVNDFISSGETVMRVSLKSMEELNYFYSVTVASVNTSRLDKEIWVKKTVFSPENGFSFLMFNLKIASEDIIARHNAWLNQSREPRHTGHNSRLSNQS